MNFLPGWFPGDAVGGGLSNVRLESSNSIHNANIVAQGGIRSGDFLFCLDFASREHSGNPTPTKNIPAGFTELYERATTDVRYILSGKISDGSESGQTLVGSTWSLDNKSMRLYVFRGNRPVKNFRLTPPVEFGFLGLSAGTLTHDIDSGAGQTPLIAFSIFESSSKPYLVDHGLSVPPSFDSPPDAGFPLSQTHNWMIGVIQNRKAEDVTATYTKLGSDFNARRYTGWIELQ